MQQNNMNANMGITNPSSGVVNTSDIYAQQGPGTQAGAVYTSGVNTSSFPSTNGYQNNVGHQVSMTDPYSGAVYTSGLNQQQGPGNLAGAVYTSGVNTSGLQSNFTNQRNSYGQVGIADPNSGAVYTSGTNQQQGFGNQAGAVYTSGVNTSGLQPNFTNLGNTVGHVGMADLNSGAVYTSGTNQQQGYGNQAGAVYTSGVNTSGVQPNFTNQRNTFGQVGISNPNSGAVYTSSTNQQQGLGTQAGAVYTSGVNNSGMQSNFTNQRNTYGQVGMTDPNSGAVYTSGTNQQQGQGAQLGNTSGINNFGMASNLSNSSMGNTWLGNSDPSNVQQIKQQLQNMQTQLRQSQSVGYESEVYVDVANRLQGAYEILNQTGL